MPISNDGIIKSANYIMSKLGCVESPIVVSFIIVGVICLILLYAFGDKIKELDKKVMYKVFVSISIIVIVAIFVHDTLLLKSMDKPAVLPYANTNQINPNTISGGMHTANNISNSTNAISAINVKSDVAPARSNYGASVVVNDGGFVSLTDRTFDNNYGERT